MPDRAPATYTTEDVLQLLAQVGQQILTPLIDAEHSKAIRVYFSMTVAELKRRDADTARVLRRLASERLRRVTNEDPRAADLRDDPRDLFHHEFLVLANELGLATWAHDKAEGGPDVGNVVGTILGRLRP